MAVSLSVVIVALNGSDLLHRCVEAVHALGDDTLDVIVVRDWTPATGPAPGLRVSFPSVRWIIAPGGATVPAMRQFGIEASNGDRVALIEDDCIVQPGWSGAVRAGLTGDVVAVGGAVEPGSYRSLCDWGVYFCEYGRFMRPLPERTTADLAGMNVAYVRSQLESVDRGTSGFLDWFVHAEWERQGVNVRVSDTMVVRNVNTWRSSHVTSIPYHHGRAFAGQRFANVSWPRRLALSCGAVMLLPCVKTGRIAAVVLRRRRYRSRFLAALPWVVLFNTAWSLGEAVGCVLGPGSSPLRWRGRPEER